MTRPDLNAILAPLKPFQRRTVDHAFHRLFEAGDSTSRFLVADEVGLGKTLVARGVIARAIDLLWDDVGRIDIIYICSNVSIARANREKLRVSAGEEQSVALSTRLTMLATDLAPKEGRASLTESRLNFVSFTPSTSFDMGNSSGQAKERAVLFRLLSPLVSRRIPLMNLLQGGVTRTDRWRRMLEESERNIPLEPGIQQRFVAEYGRRPDVSNELEALLDEWFARHRKHWPEPTRQRRNRLIGELRHLLAGICVDALEPDLVILDEFQRFKSLLENNAEKSDPAAELAHALFRARTPEGHPVRTLLLSATPYKLYTADAEIEQEDHYADFLATTRFLMAEDEARVAGLKKQIGAFSAALKRAAFGDVSAVAPAKVALQETLLAVMTRTERVGATASLDGMVEEARTGLALLHQDVRQYVAADALFRAVGDQDPITYWKSAPYLLHFMRNYRFNERLEEARDPPSDKLTRVLHDHASSFLQARGLEAWAPLEPANAKLRALAGDLPGRRAVAPALDAAHGPLLAARRPLRGPGGPHQDPAVLGMERGPGGGERRAQLRGRAPDDGRATGGLPGPCRSAVTAPAPDPQHGRQSVTSPAVPAAVALSPTG
ncbi:MAG: hypothetical protein U5S82_13540 [Gammaproteobacteria bacterium]|nr:hypothetical protein [Gammaproteobacteria bacterium]